MLCYKCNENIPDNSLVCPLCGAEMSVFARRFNQNGMSGNPFASRMPMNWYRFLIYFSLFASAVSNIINGIFYITGGVYNIQSLGAFDAYSVYNQFGKELMIIDIIYGIASIAFAVLNLVTRSKLAKFKKNAPVYLYVMYAFGAVVSLVYAVAIEYIAGVAQSLNGAVIMQTLIQGVVLYGNYIYFSKRKHFFVN